MPSRPFVSYNTHTTSIEFPWPPEITGLERIALSAQGGLQRILSSFFARPISIATVYSDTSIYSYASKSAVLLSFPNPSAIASASSRTPIVQSRQVHLQCSGKTVCTATSTVHITSPKCAHLFLEEKYAIGQMFTLLEKVPRFELLSVGLGRVRDDGEGGDDEDGASDITPAERKQLWRKYKLVITDFECTILEVFPDREMFILGEKWLDDGPPNNVSASFMESGYLSARLFGAGNKWILFFTILLLALEVSLLFSGRYAALVNPRISPFK